MIPLPPRPARPGAADAVDVALVVLRRIEVDHVGDVVEVEAARGDVGRDERRHLAARGSARARARARSGSCRRASRRRGRRAARASAASRSAPRFVRTKTSASPRSRLELSISASTLPSAVTATNGGRRLAAARRPPAARPRSAPGCCVYARASSPTSPSSVAEKSIVCRSRGRRRTIRSTCGLKPMSSMRSASSSTRMRTLSSVTSLRSTRSWSRPGVATRMCAPLAPLGLARRAARRRRPPRRAAASARRSARAPRRPARRARASARARARPARRCRPSIALDDRQAEASVLPEPVGAFASTSAPASASGRTSAWMRKGLCDVARGERLRDVCAHAERAKRRWDNVRLLAFRGRDRRLETPEGGTRS